MIEVLKDFSYHPGSSSGETFQEKKWKKFGLWESSMWRSKTESLMEKDPSTLSSGEKGGFFSRTLRHLQSSTCQHPKLISWDALINSKSCKSPFWRRFFLIKNDRCGYMELKYLKHPNK